MNFTNPMLNWNGCMRKLSFTSHISAKTIKILWRGNLFLKDDQGCRTKGAASTGVHCQ